MPSLRSKKHRSTADQVNAVDSLIDSMNLMDVSEESPDVEAFANNKILNPATQHMYRVLTHRALHPNQPIPVVDTDLSDHLNVPPKLKASAAPAVATIKALFPLEHVAKASKEQFFNRVKNITSNVTNVDAPTVDDLVIGSPDNGQAANDASRLVEVGTMTPAEDFGELLRRGEKFSTLCAQIQAVIGNLVLKAVHVPTQKVAMAIMVYREEARLIGAWRYNEWIVEFKRMLVERRKLDVWHNVVVKERLGLITALDAETSTVGEEEAQSFYRLAGGGGMGEKVWDNEEDDIDDLIGNM